MQRREGEYSSPLASSPKKARLLGALYTQFIDSEQSIFVASNVHSSHTICSPWHGRILQLLRVNTRRIGPKTDIDDTDTSRGNDTHSTYSLIAAGSILRDFALEYAAQLGDVSIICAVTRCTEFRGLGEKNSSQVSSSESGTQYFRNYILQHQKEQPPIKTSPHAEAALHDRKLTKRKMSSTLVPFVPDRGLSFHLKRGATIVSF